MWDPGLSWDGAAGGEPRSIPQIWELWEWGLDLVTGEIWYWDLVPGSGVGIWCWDLVPGSGIWCWDLVPRTGAGVVVGSGSGIWHGDVVSAQAEPFPRSQVDFIWITRDQQHLQWFLGLLAQLEAEQAELEPGGERERPAPFPGKSPPQCRLCAGAESLEFQGISWSCTCT